MINFNTSSRSTIMYERSYRPIKRATHRDPIDPVVEQRLTFFTFPAAEKTSKH